MTNEERRLSPAAAHLGITVAEYMDKRAQGLKWCAGQKHWEHIEGFARNMTAGDGRAFECRKCQKARRDKYRERNRARNLARQSGEQQNAN